MEIREESGLKFGFPDENIVIKFDDTKYYWELLNKLPESKGVDSSTYNKDIFQIVS